MKRMVIALLVLVGLLVAADFGAAASAESAVSRQMREQLGLVDDPSVRINGFPFLTQAAAGRYRSVDVSALRSLFTVRVDPGRLPLAVTPTELKAVNGALEISGETEGLVLGGASASAGAAGG